MIELLGLSGNSLTVFALINSFTETNGGFNGSEQYLADWLGLSRRSIVRIVNELKANGLLTVDDGKYRTISSLNAKKMALSKTADDKTSHVTDCHQNRTKCHTKSDNLSHNNTNYNTTITPSPPPHSACARGKSPVTCDQGTKSDRPGEKGASITDHSRTQLPKAPPTDFKGKPPSRQKEHSRTRGDAVRYLSVAFT